MMNHKFTILSLFTFLFLNSNAQFFLDTTDLEHCTNALLPAKSLYFDFKVQSFLKNNEYFNELYDGITFLGADFNPYFIYKPHAKFIFLAGWYGRIFNARERLYINSFFYRIQYQLSSRLYVIMGNLFGHDQHRLIEPIYSSDNYYLHKPESGLQFWLNSKKIKTDLWLNWQKFILPGDPFKEEFVIGNTTFFNPCEKNKGSVVSIPINFLAKHRGGQGTTSQTPLQTYFNWSIGVDLKFKSQNYLIGIQGHYVQFNDVSNEKLLRYTDGYGVYSIAYWQSYSWQIQGGYWFGEYYVAPLGEPLFQSLSRKYVGYQEPQKQLILFKIQYAYKSIKQCPLFLQFAFYYDYQRNYFDFSYGLQIKFSEKFRVCKDLPTFE